VKSPEILRRLVQRFGLLLALTLIGGAAGGVYGAVKQPTYTAKAYVVAIGDPGEAINALNFAQAYGRIATSGPVLVLAEPELGVDKSGLREVTASTSPDAPVIEITSTGRSAQHTTALANAIANALINLGNTRKTETHITLELLAGATIPSQPSSPKPPLELAVGAAAGLLIGGLTVLAGVGRASAARLRATAEARYEVAEVDEQPARPAEIERYMGGWRAKVPQKAITAYRSPSTPAEVEDGSKVIAFAPIPVTVERVVGRATVAGAEDERLDRIEETAVVEETSLLHQVQQVEQGTEESPPAPTQVLVGQAVNGAKDKQLEPAAPRAVGRAVVAQTEDA
jgi:capsular polysaccharide biosynthesis protein